MERKLYTNEKNEDEILEKFAQVLILIAKELSSEEKGTEKNLKKADGNKEN